MTVNYDSYSLNDLYEILDTLNPERDLEQTNQIKDEIKIREKEEDQIVVSESIYERDGIHIQSINEGLLLLMALIYFTFIAYLAYEVGLIISVIFLLIILVCHRGFIYKVAIIEKEIHHFSLYFRKKIIPISTIQKYYTGLHSDFIESEIGSYKIIRKEDNNEQFQSIIFKINNNIKKEEFTEGLFFLERILKRLDLENHPFRAILVVFATIIFAIIIPIAFFSELIVELAVEYDFDVLKYLETDLKYLIFGQGEEVILK